MNNMNRHRAGLRHELADSKAAENARIERFSEPDESYSVDTLHRRRNERNIVRGNRVIAGVAALAVIGALAASHFLPRGEDHDHLTPTEAAASKQIAENQRANIIHAEQIQERQQDQK